MGHLSGGMVRVVILMLVLIAAVFGVGAVMWWLKRGAARGPSRPPPFCARESLVSAAERSFLAALDAAIGPEHRVFAKVRLADIVTLRGAAESRTGLMNKVRQKHVDFVVCDRNSLRFVAVIELDDSTHETPKGRARDAFVDSALRAAGLPLVRFRAVSNAKGYAPAEIARRLAEAR